MKVKITHRNERNGIHRDENRTRYGKIFLFQGQWEKYQSDNIKEDTCTVKYILVLCCPFFEKNISKRQKHSSERKIGKKLVFHKWIYKKYSDNIRFLGNASGFTLAFFWFFIQYKHLRNPIYDSKIRTHHGTRNPCPSQIAYQNVLQLCKRYRTCTRTKYECMSYLYGIPWDASDSFWRSSRSRSTSKSCDAMRGDAREYIRPKKLLLSWSSDGIPDHSALSSDRQWWGSTDICRRRN